jgi:hypothetical protein
MIEKYINRKVLDKDKEKYILEANLLHMIAKPKKK